MKKLILLGLMAATILVGCGEDESVKEQNK